MVDPNELEDVEEEKNVLDEIVAFQEKKEQADETNKKLIAEKKKKDKEKESVETEQETPPTDEETENVTSTDEIEKIALMEEQPKPVQPPVKPKKEKVLIDISAMNIFKDKLVKDFGLTASVEKSGNTILKYNGFLMIKLLPRRCCRFGVCREIPEQDNIWKAFRINTDEEQEQVYNHVKKLVEVNKPKD